MLPLAVYIHWPFCVSKCPYCDFNSQPTGSVDHKAWVEAYKREISHYARRMPEHRVKSIYFGGGTPSLMTPSTVEAVIESINQHWPRAEDVEITLEANPIAAEAEKFRSFRAAGVNRLSLGVQSLRDEALKFLGRAHDAAQAKQAIELALQTFPRTSFDLIYARQGQTPESWEAELCEMLALAPKHLSLYQLTIEAGTAFYAMARHGMLLTASEDDAVIMFERTNEIMKQAGLLAYEVSNFAMQGEESRHNLAYWHYDDYIGIGPGAHGRFVVDGMRRATENLRDPAEWLDQVSRDGHGLNANETVNDTIAQREALMMGLRLVAGINGVAWEKKFGAPLASFLPHEKVERLEAERLLFAEGKNLRATSAGLQRLNAVLDYLMG